MGYATKFKGAAIIHQQITRCCIIYRKVIIFVIMLTKSVGIFRLVFRPPFPVFRYSPAFAGAAAATGVGLWVFLKGFSKKIQPLFFYNHPFLFALASLNLQPFQNVNELVFSKSANCTITYFEEFCIRHYITFLLD